MRRAWLDGALHGVLGSFPRWVWIGLGGMAGAMLGLGLYTLTYAQGLSYLGNDPNACVNCHVMRDVFEGWTHSSHKSVATCNDCHLPHTSTSAKYVAKGRNGWHHSLAFTTGDFPEPIRIRPHNRDLAQQSCLHCHGDLVVSVLSPRHAQATDCLRCHARVGHGW